MNKIINYEYVMSKTAYNELLALINADKFSKHDKSENEEKVIKYLNATAGLNREIRSLKLVS